MKKLLIAASLSSLVAGSAFADQSKIIGADTLEIAVHLHNPTCVLEKLERKVDFGSPWFDSKSLTKTVQFNVTGCSLKSKTKVKVAFSPDSNLVEDGKLLNVLETDNAAKNVFLLVKDANQKNVLAADYESEGADTLDLDPKNNPGMNGQKLGKTFTYTLELTKEDGATPGAFVTMLPYTVAYQ